MIDSRELVWFSLFTFVCPNSFLTIESAFLGALTSSCLHLNADMFLSPRCLCLNQGLAKGEMNHPAGDLPGGVPRGHNFQKRVYRGAAAPRACTSMLQGGGIDVQCAAPENLVELRRLDKLEYLNQTQVFAFHFTGSNSINSARLLSMLSSIMS